MADRLGAAVIGCGYMGDRHARIWSELPNTRLMTLYDVDRERSAAVTETCGGRACASLDEALAEPGVDLVSICTDDQSHVAPCQAAAAAGKHILLEKPLATNLEDADAILQAVRRAGVTFLVGHVVRFDVRYNLAKQAVEQGEIGDIVHLYARRNNARASGLRIGGRTSVVHFLGVHDLDIMRWIAESEIVRVYAESARKVLAGVGADDTVFAVMKFANGAAGCLELCWAMPPGAPAKLDARLDVLGTRGEVSVSVHGEGLQVALDDAASCPEIVYGPQIEGRQEGALKTQLEHFARCVAEGEAPLISPDDARAAVAAACAIHESLATGQPVQLS